MSPDDFFRQAQLQPESPDFVFEQVAQRLDQFEGQILGQSADVVVQLDRGGRSIGGGTAFDDVGIKRSLGQEAGPGDFDCFVGKTFDKGVADAAAFFLRIGNAGQGRQEFVLGLDDVQIGLEVLRKFANDRLFFVLAQQAVVDQDATELRADGPVQEGRDDRRIDPARQAANHPIGPDAATNLLDRLLGKIAEPPRAVALANVGQEIGQHRFAQRRVGHFGMELQAVDRQAAVLDGRDRAGGGARQRREFVRHADDLIAMAHPNFGFVGQAGEQVGVRRDREFCPAIFPGRALATLPPSSSQASCIP